ncbi:right-handed parallel beta-helix repeat-containing protein [Fontivita pretiosa]|uniref:right-handed parallel beta-helix repeat-containing protein n=1 Tax=Fontivita pretiosa TaxID=2989684 RepID=UPI003D1827D0
MIDRRRLQPPPAASLETLEPRQLLAVLNVNDFGATPNGGTDDRGAILAAINASAPGDTILFPGGTYNITQPIVVKGGGRIYKGANGATIVSNGAGKRVFHLVENNATFSQLTFQGAGLFIDRTNSSQSGMVQGVIVDNCRFNVQGGGNGIEFTVGLRNSRITNNTFNPINGDNGIYGYNWDNLVIANNEFYNGNEGIHLIAHWDPSPNLLIEQNYFSGLRRMGIEIQGGGVNTIIQDNFYENPSLSPRYNDNLSCFAYSIICDRSQNTIVRRNTSIAPQRPDGTGVRVIFELGGFNLQAYDNYSYGGNHVVAVNGTNATGVVRDNRFSNYLIGPSNANGAKVVFINNGPNVPLTWDINRGRPYPNQRFGEAPPVGEAPESPSALSYQVQSISVVNLFWTDESDNELGYRIEVLSDDGTSWHDLASVGENVTSFTVTGLNGTRTYTFRVRSYNQFGVSDPSNAVLVAMPRVDIITNEDLVNELTPIGDRRNTIGAVRDLTDPRSFEV